MVMGGDSCACGCKFKSQCPILDFFANRFLFSIKVHVTVYYCSLLSITTQIWWLGVPNIRWIIYCNLNLCFEKSWKKRPGIRTTNRGYLDIPFGKCAPQLQQLLPWPKMEQNMDWLNWNANSFQNWIFISVRAMTFTKQVFQDIVLPMNKWA